VTGHITLCDDDYVAIALASVDEHTLSWMRVDRLTTPLTLILGDLKEARLLHEQQLISLWRNWQAAPLLCC